jgi:hypothetical protein
MTDIQILSYPFDEGFKAATQRLPLSTNPYKSPNTPKTDDVKSEAWLTGYDSCLYPCRK